MIFKTFKNHVFGTVSVLADKTGIYFIGTEIAEKLGYTAGRNAIDSHVDDDDKIIYKYKTTAPALKKVLWTKPNDFSNKTLINESGMYALIFGSKLKQAKEFKHWVTKYVLPSIRKNGGYILGQEHLNEKESSELNNIISELSKKVKSLGGENNVLNKQMDFDFKIFMKLISENEKLMEENARLKKSVEPVEPVKPVKMPESKIQFNVVDKDGFIISKYCL